IATVIGVVSGFYGRWLDTLAQRVVDIWMAFPALVLLITIISIFSSTGRLQLVIALGIILAAGTSRIVRGATLALKANMYVEAARSIGASDLRVMVVHIIPNLVPIIIVLATVQIGAAILAEATISFLGYGIAPPFPTWGQMLSPSELALMRQHPHLSLFPGLTIAVTVYAFNVLGDALRDILDPRLRGT
ncbi:MAG TPA: ABC transporter permease, partial [Dehalococcoidia bacterium]|nr:ABC transporter permease [Dehalococcoidia bacterium]